jgi:hypothetical protein
MHTNSLGAALLFFDQPIGYRVRDFSGAMLSGMDAVSFSSP